MDRLLFVAEWERDKSKTWSGTTYALRKALDNYFDIEDVSINKKYLLLFISKICKIPSKLKNKSDIHYYKIKFGKYFINNKDKIPSLVFSEYKINKYKNEFIFQDFSINNIKDMYESQREVFNISGFNKAEYKYLCKRETEQHEFYKKCSGIFVMGEWLKKDMINRYNLNPNKIHTVGGGINVDPSLIDYSNKQGNKILFIGSDFVSKNGFLLIEAFKKAKQTKKDLQLYIAGANNLEIDEKDVFVLGKLEHNEIAGYLNKCDVFCMPSIYEGYGIAFVEALTFGLPCIGSNAFEAPYLIQDGITGRLLQDNRNSSELASLILETINNQDMKKAVRAKKDEYIKKYSWEEVAKNIYNVISQQQNA